MNSANMNKMNVLFAFTLTLLRRRSLLYRNQSIVLVLFDRDHRHERVKACDHREDLGGKDQRIFICAASEHRTS